MESHRTRKPSTIRKTGKLTEHRTLGKKGGARVISIHGLMDGTVEIRPMGRGNMILDHELLKLLCAPETMPLIKRHIRDQKKLIRQMLSKRHGTPIMLREKFLAGMNASTLSLDAEVPPLESGVSSNPDVAPDFIGAAVDQIEKELLEEEEREAVAAGTDEEDEEETDEEEILEEEPTLFELNKEKMLNPACAFAPLSVPLAVPSELIGARVDEEQFEAEARNACAD